MGLIYCIELSSWHLKSPATQLFLQQFLLTHWGRQTHICVVKLTMIGSDNGLSPEQRQAIIWTNAGILLIGTLGTNFIEISIEIYIFSFKKMRLKMSSGKWRPCCLGLNVLRLASLWVESTWGYLLHLSCCPVTQSHAFHHEIAHLGILAIVFLTYLYKRSSLLITL